MNNANRRPNAEEIAAKLGDLEALPEVVTKALKILNNSRSSGQDLVKVLSLDQGITAKILATANSAYFGSSRRFVNLREAVVRLGYRNIYSILCAASASSSLSRPVTIYGMGRNELWKHSVACAICSRVIAREYKLWDPEEAYITGLLHDIGLPVLEKFVLQSGELPRLNQAASYPSYIAERMILGFDHAFLGSLVCLKWQLTQDIASVVSEHHDPLATEQPTKLAAIVHLADVISLLPEVGVHASRFTTSADPSVINWLGLDVSEIDRLVPQVRAYLNESEDFIRGTAPAAR